LEGIAPDGIPASLLDSPQPLLLKGLVTDWPIVRAAKESMSAADRYIRRFYRDATVGVFTGAAQTKGRVFYNEDMSGFNFDRSMAKLDRVLDSLQRHAGDENPPAIYVGSTTVDTCLPGFRAENDLELGGITPLVSLWLGNRTRVAAHYDVPDNIACCAAGRRRFTLFPPDQLQNLYVGPLDFNPAGQAISLVDFANPNFDRHPLFRKAMQQAQVAEMEPGDALYIPGMWWHHVEGLDPLNLLVNYWWKNTPSFMGSPANVLDHAFLGLRDLPREQRIAWAEIFRYYIFEHEEADLGHIPEPVRGVLSGMDDTEARKLRARLLNKLNR